MRSVADKSGVKASIFPMPNAQNATIVTTINDWYQQFPRQLPWGEPDCSAWGILVSEVMLQQTPVARVEPIWREWMRRWPTPADLADAELGEVLRSWGGLGYPRRAKWLRECAIAIRDDFGGELPRNEVTLRSLPGIGEYTAAAVASFAFRQRTLVLDTNIRRVIARLWTGQELPRGHVTNAERDFSRSLLPEVGDDCRIWNLASMELGAVVCTSRSPKCEQCPVSSSCLWKERGFPVGEVKRKAQSWHGSDRQVRGAVMAVMRASDGPVELGIHPDLERFEVSQVARCLESLLADELIRRDPSSSVRYLL